MACTSRRLIAVRADTINSIVESSQSWRRCVLYRVAVFSASPGSSLLTLKLELFLSLGVSKSEEELDPVVLCQNTVVVSDDMLSDFTGFKSGPILAYVRSEEMITDLAKPTSLLTPEGVSLQIFVEIALNGRKCFARSASFQSIGTPVQ